MLDAWLDEPGVLDAWMDKAGSAKTGSARLPIDEREKKWMGTALDTHITGRSLTHPSSVLSPPLSILQVGWAGIMVTWC